MKIFFVNINYFIFIDFFYFLITKKLMITDYVSILLISTYYK